MQGIEVFLEEMKDDKGGGREKGMRTRMKRGETKKKKNEEKKKADFCFSRRMVATQANSAPINRLRRVYILTITILIEGGKKGEKKKRYFYHNKRGGWDY